MFSEFLKKYAQVLGIGCGCLTLFVVLAIVGGICAAEMFSSEETTQSNQEEPTGVEGVEGNGETIAVTVGKILDDYESNALRADDVYKGRSVEVTGVVVSVDDGMFGSKVVTLSDGSEFSFEVVKATLLDSAVPAAKALSKGDSATLTCGEITGDLLGVSMGECSVE